MRRAVLLTAVLVVSLLGIGVAASAAQAKAAGYIVVYRGSVTDVAQKTKGLERANGFETRFRYGHALKGFAAKLSAPQARRLRLEPGVASVTRDRTVRVAGSVPVAPGDSAPTGVRRMQAATTTTVQDASSVGVAVIDTGVDLTHTDLDAVAGKSCVPNKSAQDDNGHGTHVAGTIAARNNGSGVVGVAPGTRVYAVKVLSSAGSGSWSQVICGIDWVTEVTATLNVKVANMSLAGLGIAFDRCGNPLDSDALHRAICNSTAKGVTYVAAAGNEASDLSTSVPAAYPEVLTVTAMSDSDGAPGGSGGEPTCRGGESDDSYATFSNFATQSDSGAIAHMIAAPGICIRSTWLGGGYRTISGTSMAAPHMTGAVALCIGTVGSAGVSRPGPCTDPVTGQTRPPGRIIARVRFAAAVRGTADNGFIGDPNHPVADEYFGYLGWAGY